MLGRGKFSQSVLLEFGEDVSVAVAVGVSVCVAIADGVDVAAAVGKDVMVGGWLLVGTGVLVVFLNGKRNAFVRWLPKTTSVGICWLFSTAGAHPIQPTTQHEGCQAG